MRRPLFIRVALPLILLTAATPRLFAQVDAGEPTDSVVAQEASAAGARALETQVSAGGGLPERPTPPRTMADRWPIFLLLALAWLGIVGDLLRAGHRAARLGRRISELEGGR